MYGVMRLLTLLLSQLVTGGRDTTALLESLKTAYDSAPSMRLRYLSQETHKDDRSVLIPAVPYGIADTFCKVNKVYYY